MQLPIELMRTFALVVETASFTRAGELVNRSQSAVSQQMQRLEEVVGKKLVERNGRTVTPTPQGEELLAHARRLLKVHDEAVAAMARPEISGVVRLGASDDYASCFLPEVLSRFACCHPMVQVEVYCDVSSRLRDARLSGELDLAVFASSQVPDGAEVLARQPLRWVTSARHLVHEKRPLPVAVYDSECVYRKWALAALDNASIGYRIAYVSRSLAGIQATVRAGLAVAALSGGFVAPGTRVLGEAEGFPTLPEANHVMLRGPNTSEPIESLARTIAEEFHLRLESGGCRAVA
jgi:DNA-binding transcriptional LysR family regulator